MAPWDRFTNLLSRVASIRKKKEESAPSEADGVVNAPIEDESAEEIEEIIDKKAEKARIAAEKKAEKARIALERKSAKELSRKAKKAEKPTEDNEENDEDVISEDRLSLMIENGDVSDDGRSDPTIAQEYEEYKNTDADVEDMLGEISDEQKQRFDDTKDKMDESLRKDETKTRIKALDSVGKDQDEELQRLLAEDGLADAKRKEATAPEEEISEPLRAPDVYVKIAGEDREEVPPERKDAIAGIADRIPKKVMLGAIAASLVIMIAFAIVFIIVTKPPKDTVANDAPQSRQYTFLHTEAELSGEAITLEKISYDGLQTMFYFDRLFETDRYVITLTDDAGNLYGLDYSFAPFAGTPDNTQTVLRFGPFEASAKRYTLTVADATAGDEPLTFEGEVNGRASMAVTRFATAFADIPGGDFSIDIELVRLGGSGCAVYYAINAARDGEALYFDDREENKAKTGVFAANISLGGEDAALPTKSAPNAYTFGNTIAGRMDFTALRNVSGGCFVTFRGMFGLKKIGEYLNAEALYMSKEDAGIVVRAGGYDLCFERIVRANDKFYLVMHAENRAIPKSEDDDYSDRVEAIVEARMRFENEEGAVTVIEGVPRTMRIGADILFDATDYMDEIGTPDPERISIEIINAAISLGDISARLDFSLDPAEGEAANNELVEITNNTETTLKNRLDYKAGRIKAGEIIGFAPGVLDDESINRYYAPLENVEDDKAAVIITAFARDKTREDRLYIVAQESWRAVVDGAVVDFHVTHKITAWDSPEGFTIIADELVR